MRQSLYNNTRTQRTLSPATRTAAVTGAGVDRHVGNGAFRTAKVVVATGVITDGTHTVEVQDSDDNVTFAAVADEFLQGTEPAIAAADDDKVFEIGYTGHKRYLRVVVTSSGVTGGVYGAVVELGQGRRPPVSHA